LQSYGYLGAGYGEIGTGNASAVGNRSETYVQQIAAAVASGDGVASIVQDVLVANVGAAGANTGGNQLGRSIADLDEPTAKAVVMMSAFLAQLLSMVNQTATQLTSAGIEVPFGDLVLQLNGSFGALDTTLSKGGARVNMRQISIVMSLGVARANTGVNQILTIQPEMAIDSVALDSSTARTAQVEMNSDAALAGAQETLAAIDALPNQIQTGDAAGRNTNLVIICQRYNAQDVTCLAPKPPVAPPVADDPSPVVTTPTPGVAPTPAVAAVDSQEPAVLPPVALVQVAPQQPTSASSTVGDPFRAVAPHAPQPTGGLPSTGSDVDMLLLLGALVAAGGTVLLVATRRRRSP
jgi:LPXTG-motif cell wall-anchored protein